MSDAAVSHLEKLVGFNTVSDRSNADLIHYAAEVLRQSGVDPVLIPDASSEKVGLHATIGPPVPGGIVLAGHSDVVPTTHQNWSSDPFRLTERGGRLYGRGSTDMKGFLAVCLAMVPKMQRVALERPFHLVFSYDEETTCRGVLPVIDDMVAKLPAIEAVIVGEPTSMQVVNAHKGAYGYKVTVSGKPAHSSLTDQGVSANVMAARLVVWLDEQMQTNAMSATYETDFSPNYTTCHAGTIQGGTACNIIAGHCSFEWDLRTLPNDDPKQFLRAFQKKADEILATARMVAPESRIDIVEDYAVPGLSPEAGGTAEALCLRLTGQKQGIVVSYSSEGGQFQAADLSTVLLGPGSIDQAHIADEYVERSQIDECTAFLDRLVEAQTS